MAGRLTYHKLLSRDGLWRVANFKYLVRKDASPTLPGPYHGNSTNGDLRIEVVIGRVVRNGERSETVDLETVPVPIGDLPLLRRNRLIRDGYLLHEQYELDKEIEKDLILDLSPENLKLFNRFGKENSESIIKTSKHSSPEDSESLYLGIAHEGDTYAVIIPCIDILMFFYANSTFLTQLVLSEAILNPELNIYDRHKSIKTGRHRKIWLKEGIPSKDALYLAMLLFDDYAIEAAQSIYQHRPPLGPTANHWAIRAIPPIKGKVRLKLKGRYLGSRLVVTEIMSCGWVPPFSQLEWGRDGTSSSSLNGKAYLGSPRKLVDVDAPDSLSDGAGDRRTIPSEVREAHLAQRFPNLKKVPVKRSARPERKEKEGGHYVRERVPTEEASTAQGGHGPRNERRAEVREQEKSSAETSTEQEELENIQLDAKDFHDQCASSAILLLKAHKLEIAKVEFLTTNLTKATLSSGEDRIPLCLLPKDVENKRKAWLFSDEEKLTQRATFIAKVEFEGNVRYIFELQMRLTQKISTALIWSEPHREIQEQPLRELLLAIADPSASTALLQLTTTHNLQRGRCRHKTLNKEEDEANRAKDFLDRLFATIALQEDDLTP